MSFTTGLLNVSGVLSGYCKNVCILDSAITRVSPPFRVRCGLWPLAWRAVRWRWCTWRHPAMTWTVSDSCSEQVPDRLTSWSWREHWPIRWLQLYERWKGGKVLCARVWTAALTDNLLSTITVTAQLLPLWLWSVKWMENFLHWSRFCSLSQMFLSAMVRTVYLCKCWQD